jgi:hypothetical protein
MTLAELKGRKLEELLQEVAHSRQPITVILEEGESATIEPSSQLKPLTRLEGRVPDG